jgi:membrane protein HdeD
MRTLGLMFAGVVLVVGGVVALLNPWAATVMAEQLAGWFFLLAGGGQVLAGMQQKRRPGWWPSVLLGVLGVVVGLLLLLRPFAGIISLTLLVAVFFLISGGAKLTLSYTLRKHPAFWLMLLSGAVSVFLGGMIIAGFPGAATMVLGTLLAVDLLSSGAALFALGLTLDARKT